MCYATHYSDDEGAVQIGILAARIVRRIQVARTLAEHDGGSSHKTLPLKAGAVHVSRE